MLQTLFDSINTLGASSNDSAWLWTWLSNLVGNTAAATIQALVMTAIYGLVVYLDVIQFIRFLQNMGNRNHEDGKVRAEARESIKQSLFIIACITVIGGGGFTALFYFIGKIDPQTTT